MRLSELVFDDLYIPFAGAGAILVKNLMVQGEPSEKRVPVRRLPEACEPEARAMIAALAARWEDDGKPDEFSLVHEGRAFRVALIRNQTKQADDNDQWVWCLRRLGHAALDIESMGLPRTVSDKLKALGGERGLTLISGSFGSGKTTTAASCIMSWAQRNKDIGVTIEDPIEVPISRVCDDHAIYQIEIPEHEFARGVRAARRWAPRYVMLGDIQTPEAAQELLRIALSGPMVVSTIHASDPVRAIINLVSFASEAMSEDLAREMVAEAIHSVIHQDRRWGMIDVRVATISGQNDFARRNLIRVGKFHMLNEALGLTMKHR